MTEGIVTQVTQIMAKIDDPATTEAEREMLMRRAQTLTTRHGLDAAKLRQALEKSQRREVPIQKTIRLGQRLQVNKAVYCELFMAIGRVQDLEFNIAHDSTYVVAFGFPTDIEVTEAMYASLVTQMTEESGAYLRSGEYKKHPEHVRVKKRYPNPHYSDYGWASRRDNPKYLYEWVWEYKPVSGVTARREFNQAWISKVGQRMREAKREAVKSFQSQVEEQIEALADVLPPEPSASDGAMILVKKQQEVDDFYKKTSRAKGSWKGDAASYHSSSAARGAGREAGARADLGGRRTAISGSGRAVS